MKEKLCSKCRKNVPADANFCPNCGASTTGHGEEVIVVTMPTVPGYRVVRVLGIAHGITVRTRGVGGKIVAGIEGIFGGEVTSYSSEAEKARRDSLARLIDSAKKMGANAIVRADFETSDILQGSATLFSAYGTAVVIQPEEDETEDT